MRHRIIIAAAAAILFGWPFGDARGAASDRDRVIVELGVTAPLPDEQAGALSGLLETQLRPHGLSPRFALGVGDVRRWLSRDSSDVLLRVALEAPAVGGWRLLLVDAARGRAVARTLTGGVRRDRAAIEAVCDIVVSAAVALREGFEVASQTVDEALEGTGQSGTPSAAGAAPIAASRSDALPSSRPGLRLQAGAGPTLATFARAAPISWGGDVAIGIWLGGAGLELSAARYASQTITASDGSFAIDRTQVGLSAAAAAHWRRVALSGSAGLLLEILQRGETSPTATVIAASSSDAVTRVGPQATAMLAVSLSRRLAIAWIVGLGYFPRHVEYLSSAGSAASLAAPWPLTGSSALRVELSFP